MTTVSENAQNIQHAFEWESGSILLGFAMPPASQQSARTKKDTVTNAIQGATVTSPYLITGDIRIEIDWYIHEQLRYETADAPDVDNILKPTLDALAGPDGLMIDDCQVQAIDCRWIGANDDTQTFSIRLSFMPDGFISKDGFRFIQTYSGLCIPISNKNHQAINLLFVKNYLDRVALRDEALVDGSSWSSARALLPILPMFHRSRIGNFPVSTIQEFLLEFGLISMPTIEAISQMVASQA